MLKPTTEAGRALEEQGFGRLEEFKIRCFQLTWAVISRVRSTLRKVRSIASLDSKPPPPPHELPGMY